MNVVTLIAALAAAGFSAWRLYRRLQFFLHIHQLEGYRAGPFLRWVVSRPFDVVLRWSHVAGIAILAGLWILPLPDSLALFLWSIAFASSRRYRRNRPKKPLVATPRLIREAVAACAVSAAVFAAGAFAIGPSAVPTGAGGPVAGWPWLIGVGLGVGLADLAAPLSVWLAGLILTPVERGVREGFKRAAVAKLAGRPDLTVVAITGSYGKTSVKFAIAEVLSQRFQVLATPGSFNTPMGICRVINNDLRDHHQVLVLEMGIRHPGDIKELCQIARPDIAVVTGIGIAHLESMGSRDAIAREKGGLLSFLRPGGVAVLNADDDYHAGMSEGVHSVSVSSRGAKADFVGADIQFGPAGTTFMATGHSTLTWRDHGGAPELPQSAWVKMQLLGRHHVDNALLALAVGHLMGIRIRSGARALARQSPVAHRLSMREEGGLLILDDAFNSNPVGAQNAVEVLGQFAPRQRFVVTPGMIELGEMEFEANRAFGASLVGRVDHAILVGPARTAAISAGLREAGMDPARIHVDSTLFEARATVARLAQPGDVVLFENDLPDQYTET
jgi:UDP-N-acetylmuramoyl-tripeptide--D-alanyl-D-alanine ligase